MASRPSWDGFLKFNLISVPVKAYSATVSGGGKIGFHLIHKGCQARIRYKKVCPIHGEVSNDEIVSAYEHAKGQYLVVGDEERKNLKVENDKAISIDTFIPPGALEPLYFTERSYYLVPDGKVAQKPYAVLREAMAKDSRYAIARVVFAGQGRVAVVRPVGGVLAMTLLSYEDQLKKPAAFAEEVTAAATAEELRLAETLIEAATVKDFDLGRYKDEYTTGLVRLLEKKGRAKKSARAPADKEPAVINLMDALRKSLDQAHHPAGGRGGRKPSRGRKSGKAAARRKTG